MSVSIRHSKVSGKAAGNDPTRVYGTHWDEDHVVPVATTEQALAGTSNDVLATPLGVSQYVAATVRERLTAARTYYVRTDGSDSNNGLADTAAGAFLTLQKAADTAWLLDNAGYAVTIQIGDGTYTSGCIVAGEKIGTGVVSFKGNASTPSNVVISTTSTSCFTANDGARIAVQDLELRTTTSGSGLITTRAGQINFTNVIFGACATFHIRASDSGRVVSDGNYSISGSAPVHWSGSSLGIIRCASRTITLTGTPAFSTAFAAFQIGAVGVLNSNTFSGSATGVRYDILSNGVIYTNGAATTAFPGNAAGTTATGGVYV